jgi:hypothetical protein
MKNLVKHYSKKIEFPFSRKAGGQFRFNSIIVKGDSALISGSVGSIYAAENGEIRVYPNGEVRVLGAHDFDITHFFDLNRIRDFVDFVKDNIDIEYYESQPTNSGLVMLTIEDCNKIEDWAKTHKFKFNESAIFDKVLKS